MGRVRMKNITTDILEINGFVQRKNWWHYKKQQVFWVNLLSEIIRLNTRDKSLDFIMPVDITIEELVAIAESWNQINSFDRA